MDRWGHHWQDVSLHFSPMAQFAQCCALCGVERTIIYTFTPTEINHKGRTMKIIEQGWQIKGNANIPCIDVGHHCNLLTKQVWDAEVRQWTGRATGDR